MLLLIACAGYGIASYYSHIEIIKVLSIGLLIVFTLTGFIGFIHSENVLQLLADNYIGETFKPAIFVVIPYSIGVIINRLIKR